MKQNKIFKLHTPMECGASVFHMSVSLCFSDHILIDWEKSFNRFLSLLTQIWSKTIKMSGVHLVPNLHFYLRVLIISIILSGILSELPKTFTLKSKECSNWEVKNDCQSCNNSNMLTENHILFYSILYDNVFSTLWLRHLWIAEFLLLSWSLAKKALHYK